jgi:uncharacterized surface protein with fasciclin (FAS1) repeats
MPLTRAAACRSMAAALFALGAVPLAGSRAFAVEGHLKSVLDLAATDPQLSTFVAAVQACGLADQLTGAGPFTLFVPTDAAFTAFAGGDPTTLLRPEGREKLKALLSRHIVADAIDLSLDGAMSLDLSAQTMAGNNLHIVENGRGTSVDGVPVGRDLRATNGEIHVIGTVLPATAA